MTTKAKFGALGMVVVGIVSAYQGLVLPIPWWAEFLMHSGGFMLAAYGGILLVES